MLRHYVYYRVAVGDAGRAIAAAASLQAGWRARHPGLVAELLRRPGEAGGQVTLMEVYGGPGFDAGLAARIAAEAAAALGGERHVEVFETL